MGLNAKKETYVEPVEPLNFGSDFSRGQFALTTPFLKKSEEHAVWAEFAFFAQTLWYL